MKESPPSSLIYSWLRNIKYNDILSENCSQHVILTQGHFINQPVLYGPFIHIDAVLGIHRNETFNKNETEMME